MRRELLLLGALTTGVAGCELVSTLLDAISDLSLLGVMPDPDFSEPDSPNNGKVRIAIGAIDDSFVPIQPAANNLRVETGDGEEVPIEEVEEIEGDDFGHFAILVDGSGSVEAPVGACDGCPSDPNRIRVEAVQELADSLSACGPDWNQGLFEFGLYSISSGFDYTYRHTDWTTDADEVVSAANNLGAEGGTFIWDSTWEVLDQLTKAHDRDGGDGGVGIVVISDGADLGYGRTVDQLIAHANELGVRVHTVGFGNAADGNEFQDRNAVEELSRLAQGTGGYYGFVADVNQLPELGEAIAYAQCGGHSQLVVTWPEEAEEGQEYDGRIVYEENEAIRAPFTFTGPRRR